MKKNISGWSWLIAACLSAPSLPLYCQITLQTSDKELAASFDWASRQALAYSFKSDAVGLWYEAALPGREAFCMRDTAHQGLGAQMLGLAHHTRNMLRKFAENISDSKDWCSYWEINRDNLPAPVDYQNDAEFWYNLPANFDVLDACYRMYVWTGDRTYLDDPKFVEFYRRTVHDYVDRWDLGLDRVMTRQRVMNVRGRLDQENRFQTNRGIPSYIEGDRNFVVAVDQIAAEYAGYLAYARLQQLRGEEQESRKYFARAEEMKIFLNKTWWNPSANRYYSRVDLNHKLTMHSADWPVLYYGAAESGSKSTAVLNALVQSIGEKASIGIEDESHLPEVLYRYGRPDEAYNEIMDLTREGKNRREYPEVSYSVVGAIVTGLMGIELEAAEPEKALTQYDYVDGAVATLPRLTAKTQWAALEHVPVRQNEISVRHDGSTKTAFVNEKGPSLMWEACFPGTFTTLVEDGKPVRAARRKSAAGTQSISCSAVEVGAGQTKMVAANAQ